MVLDNHLRSRAFWSNFGALVAVLVCMLLKIEISAAQSQQGKPSAIRESQIAGGDAPKSAGPLPDFAKGAQVGVYVTREHADKYRSLLPAELAELLDQGLFAFEGARTLRQQVAAPEAWAAVAPIKLEKGGELGKIPDIPKGFLFARIEANSGDDSETLTSKLLWNTTVHAWRLRSWSMALDLTFVREPKGSARRVQVAAERLYPRALGVSPGKLVPLFREKISMRSPAALEGMAWLTLRFFGDEDYVWASSPLTGNTRQMAGSNRSDSFFTGAFSPDDLMVWSGKVELLTGISAKLEQLLVPVIDTPWGEIKKTEGCASLNPNPAAAVRMNADTNRYRGLPGWVPANVLFVPRSVWRIDAVTKDPFSLDARQTLYIDEATMLPVYRTVWDDGGRLRRFTAGILGSVNIDGESVPIWRGQLMVSPAEATRSTLVPTQLSVCSALAPAHDLAAFDPSRLAPRRSPTPKAGPEPLLDKVTENGASSSVSDDPLDDPDASAGE